MFEINISSHNLNYICFFNRGNNALIYDNVCLFRIVTIFCFCIKHIGYFIKVVILTMVGSIV